MNLHNQLKNCLSIKIWKNYYSMCIEERGWLNFQILFINRKYSEKFGLVGIIYKCTKFGF